MKIAKLVGIDAKWRLCSARRSWHRFIILLLYTLLLYDNVGHQLVLHGGLIQYLYIHHSSCILLYTYQLIIRTRLMYHAACKVEFQPFTVVLTADVFQLFTKLLITTLLFVVVKTIEDNSIRHPRFHRANTTNHAW